MNMSLTCIVCMMGCNMQQLTHTDTSVMRQCWCNAGLVSLTLLNKPLFGPPHMHMQQPTRSHFIGDLSPQGNPLHYLSSVRSLQQWYWNHFGTNKDGDVIRPPLVINTHGWIKVAVMTSTDTNLAPMLCCAVLCCAVLCCAVLCCAVLCCNAMQCHVLRGNSLCPCACAVLTVFAM